MSSVQHIQMDKALNLNWSWRNRQKSSKKWMYYSQKFSDVKDIVYCHLNEIEPNVLQLIENEAESDSDAVIDPRNNEEVHMLVTQPCANASSKKGSVFNKIPQKSLLTREEHLLALRILVAKMNKMNLFTQDIEEYSKLGDKLNEEYKCFTEYLRTHMVSNFKYIMNSVKTLCTAFQLHYKESLKELFNHPNWYYSLQTALAGRSFGNPSSAITYTVESEVVSRVGFLAEFDRGKHTFFHPRASEYYLHEEFLRLNIQKLYFQFSTDLQTYDCDVLLPESSLIALLNAELNEDYFWEIPLKITPNSNGESNFESRNCLVFSDPLPVHNFSSRSSRLMYTNLLKTHLRVSQESSKWFDCSTGIQTKNRENENSNQEIFAVDLNQKYQLFSISDYMEQLRNTQQRIPIVKHFTDGCVTVQWKLLGQDCNPIKVLTKRPNMFCSQDCNNFQLVNLSVKLEYIAEMGTQIMTKSELMEEWIKQILTPAAVTERVHINVQTLEPMLFQKPSIVDIEEELLRVHKKNPMNFLSWLNYFLTTLSNLPMGEYLLKFDSNLRDKIKVYSKLMENKEGAFGIHSLFKDSCKVDMTNAVQFLPIDNCVVLPFHLKHSILPSSFPHWGRRMSARLNDQNSFKMKELENKKKIKQNLIAKKRTISKKAARKRKKARERSKKIIEENNMDEFEDWEIPPVENISKNVAKENEKCEEKIEHVPLTAAEIEKYITDSMNEI